jgi:hypothetical protein
MKGTLMAAHRASEPFRSTPVRLMIVFAGLLATLGLAVLPAAAAPGKANGHLIVTVGGVEVATAGPGKALRLAADECADLGLVADPAVVIDTVRAAFPNPVEVCAGVALTSKIPLEVDEAEEA